MISIMRNIEHTGILPGIRRVGKPFEAIKYKKINRDCAADRSGNYTAGVRTP